MQSIWGLFKKSDKFIFIPAIFSLLTALLITVSFFILYGFLPPKLPLFYSLPWGQEQLVAKQQFVLLPVILALITFINIFIASQLHPVQYVLRRILTLSLLLNSLILIVTAIKILSTFT